MNSTLRSIGDAKHAMYSTLLAGVVNAVLDPIFIFTVGLDLQGAAIASVIARCCALLLSIFYVLYRHKMMALFNIKKLPNDLKKFAHVAIPAMLTQIATPLGNIYIIYEVAKFGTEYIAGWAIIGRVIPVAFGMMFALSGAIGPIIGQNYGALKFTRVRNVLSEALKFMTACKSSPTVNIKIGSSTALTTPASSVEYIACLASPILLSVEFICMVIAKMSLGTIPFVSIGAHYYSAPGILYGQALGSIVFGFIALFLTIYLMDHVEANHQAENNDQHSTY